jgi:hypothetical protein
MRKSVYFLNGEALIGNLRILLLMNSQVFLAPEVTENEFFTA